MTMPFDPRVQAAREARIAARSRLFARVEEAKERLNPQALASDAVDGIRFKATTLASDGLDAARKRPWTLAAAAGLAGLFLARRPIARWVKDKMGDADETGDAPVS